MIANKRKIALLSLFVLAAVVTISLTVNIAFAAKTGHSDTTPRGSAQFFDDCLYFSSATVSATKSGYAAPSAQITISDQGDAATVTSSGFSEIGDEITIEFVIKNDSEHDAALDVVLDNSDMLYFNASVSWTGKSQVVLANGEENRVMLSIRLIKQPTCEITEHFAVTLHATAVQN